MRTIAKMQNPIDGTAMNVKGQNPYTLDNSHKPRIQFDMNQRRYSNPDQKEQHSLQDPLLVRPVTTKYGEGQNMSFNKKIGEQL